MSRSLSPTLVAEYRSPRLANSPGLPRRPVGVYPLEAIREAVTSPVPLPDNLAPEALGTGRSEIHNRVLAPIFKDLRLIEAWGTGIRHMWTELETYLGVNLMLEEMDQTFEVQFVKSEADEGQAAQGESTPEVTREVTTEVNTEVALLQAIKADTSRAEIRDALGPRNHEHFRKAYLVPAIEAGLIEMTIPDKPRSSKQ